MSDMKKVVELIKKSKYQKGFTNMAQGIIAACKMLQNRGRNLATRKIVVIGDGQPTLNFATNEAAQECKDRNIEIDFIVVSTTFDKDNAAWDKFKMLPSYPWHAHTHVIRGIDELMLKPQMFASRMLPRVCPKARSVQRVIKKSAKKGYVMVHRGRDCGNWWMYLGRHKTAKECAARAHKRGVKGFVFQQTKMLRTWDGRYWCWSDKVQGRKAQTVKDKPFEPIDDTCTCKSWYCTGKVTGGKPGWKNQRIMMTTGYSHYMVVDNANDFLEDAEKAPFAPITLAQDTELSLKE